MIHTISFSTKYKVLRCSQCQGDTEFYCNTCKHGLCSECRDNHFLDQKTIYHDVVIYREKYKYGLKQETCKRHPDGIYEKYCYSCKLPICIQCTSKKKYKMLPGFLKLTEHRKHQIQSIETVYQINRQKHKRKIYNIRGETLFNISFLPEEIKTDIKSCHTEIFKFLSVMSKKAEGLKDLIDTVICNNKFRQDIFTKIEKIQQQRTRKIYRYLATMQKYEHRFDDMANNPTKLLVFLKKTCAPKRKVAFSNITVSSTGEINMKDVIIKFISEIQIREIGKRQIKDKCLVNLLHIPVLQKSISVTGIWDVTHISCVKSDLFWISDISSLILTNKDGHRLSHISDIVKGSWNKGIHTVDVLGDLFYIDWACNIIKLSANNRTKSTLIKIESSIPLCVFCSTSNEDILVGLYVGKVHRYDKAGQHIHTIEHNDKGHKLYSKPMYITENHNGDVIVSDWDSGVVVTDHLGRHRFSYTGSPLGPRIRPYGICTDASSNIIVCDYNNEVVQIIDKNGTFKRLLLKEQELMGIPYSLSYDDEKGLLYVGFWHSNKILLYGCREGHDYLTEN